MFYFILQVDTKHNVQAPATKDTIITLQTCITSSGSSTEKNLVLRIQTSKKG